MHALNNAIGKRAHEPADMERAVNGFLAEARAEGVPEARRNHAAAGGWYSSEVLAWALRGTAMRRQGREMYRMDIAPLHTRPYAIHTCLGAVVNIRGEHWVALRGSGGEVWLLDSARPGPEILDAAAYDAFVSEHAAAFCIFAVGG